MGTPGIPQPLSLAPARQTIKGASAVRRTVPPSAEIQASIDELLAADSS